MKTDHLEILVEEQSMEAFLREFLPRLLGEQATFAIHAHQGKPDLLRKLPDRLRGYARWLPKTSRIVVIVDRDDEDCDALKRKLEQAAAGARLVTRSARSRTWQVVNRIAIEELEAWYFGDWSAVIRAFPRVSAAIPRRAQYRDPDAVLGGTWETLERILQNAGYFKSGLRKTELARTIGSQISLDRTTSRSLEVFRDVLLEMIA